ncbi:1702_t:CDS:2 [Acaulospora colombiana]|uniref:1702_t:CDS:1 n=1 Tax=Acaulospora colombiana TaxID=27376 RepID=A0ACA9JUY9_9GLOM|nr:1702_t:CDS:2 [Acaulospora colombiana]
MSAISQYVNFFINDEKPTPIAFIKKFDFSSKKEGLSSWYSTLSKTLEINKMIPNLLKSGKITKKVITSKASMITFDNQNVLTSIDKTLTNKTGNAIRKRIHDLLPEETGDQKFSKKPCLRESNQKINRGNNDFCLASSDPDSEYFNAQEANSESLVSKNRRSNSSDKENYRGEKPDFKVITSTKEEILFGEVKTKDSRSLLINKDLVKLSNFQSGALDELIKKYGNKIGLASFGIWVSGPRIRIYEMDLNYDGMYRMFLMANVVTPMERAQFLSLIPVLEALYYIKDRISEVLEVIVSDTPASSPRSTYVRMPTPPPKLVKIAIIGLPSN